MHSGEGREAEPTVRRSKRTPRPIAPRSTAAALAQAADRLQAALDEARQAVSSRAAAIRVAGDAAAAAVTLQEADGKKGTVCRLDMP